MCYEGQDSSLLMNKLKIEILHQEIPVYDKVDVLVCGGGVAGVAASVAAARNGVKTLLVERAGYLGGTATGSMMGLIVIPFKELTGFPFEFFSQLAKEKGAGEGTVVPWDIEGYKYLAEEMVINSGANILYHSWASEPIIEGNCLKGVIIENKSGRQAILADVVIDTTGDADIAARADVPYVKGREEDGAMRPVTVMGLINNVNLYRLKEWIDAHQYDVAQDPGRHVFDLDTGMVRIDGFFSIVEEAKKQRLLPENTPINYLRFSGFFAPKQSEHASLIINCTRVYGIDGTNGMEVSKAEIEGRRQLRDAIKICQQLLPGFEESSLALSSSYLGVRETRRIKGCYTLTYDDIATEQHFDDSVAVMTSVNYGTAEIHGPERGHEGSANDPWARQMVLDLIKFEFPVRCMLTDKFHNLIVAGRCASLTHEADKFVRNMGPIGQMGQAAGTLAGVMIKRKQGLQGRVPIEELRAQLIADGVPVTRD